MGQSECIEFLKGKDWVTTKQIAEGLNQSNTSVSNSLKRLFDHKEVLRKETKGPGYKWKSLD